MSYNDICKNAIYYGIGHIIGMFLGATIIVLILILFMSVCNAAMAVINRTDSKQK